MGTPTADRIRIDLFEADFGCVSEGVDRGVSRLHRIWMPLEALPTDGVRSAATLRTPRSTALYVRSVGDRVHGATLVTDESYWHGWRR